MKFTLYMLLGPFLLLCVATFVPGLRFLGYPAVIWAAFDIPVLGYYWIARVVRLAWNHGRPRTEPPY